MLLCRMNIQFQRTNKYWGLAKQIFLLQSSWEFMCWYPKYPTYSKNEYIQIQEATKKELNLSKLLWRTISQQFLK